jgi:hypothetical protein
MWKHDWPPGSGDLAAVRVPGEEDVEVHVGEQAETIGAVAQHDTERLAIQPAWLCLKKHVVAPKQQDIGPLPSDEVEHGLQQSDGGCRPHMKVRNEGDVARLSSTRRER